MKVFNCILGIFSILGAVYCIFFPGISFLNTGWIVAILIGVFGFCSIFEYIANPERKQKKNNGGLIADGVVGLIIGIGAAVVSVLAMYNVAIRAFFDITILAMFAFWLVFSGITGIFGGTKPKKNGGKMWILPLILSIAVLLAGVYGALHPVFSAMTIGYIIGFDLMLYGVKLIMSLFENEG